MRLLFLTSTPLDVRRGSGTFVGIHTLAESLRAKDTQVEIRQPRIHLPVYTLERILFNETLPKIQDCDATIGFDLDGYRVAAQRRRKIPHVAALKGVIADECRFQKGMTKLTMQIQARLEARHVRSADRVITTSRYAAGRIKEYYDVETAAIIPELIDLDRWREALAAHPATPDPAHFTVLSVCRLYRRKRLDLLLEAAHQLKDTIPNLRIRIVGDGPEREEFQEVWRKLNLQSIVEWRGDISYADLAREYNACDIFCLPSMQEGFGIVFLEAMAAGKPIVAARAAAIPEVIPQGILTEPGNSESIAAAIADLHQNESGRQSLAAEGQQRVEQFAASKVAAQFQAALHSLIP